MAERIFREWCCSNCREAFERPIRVGSDEGDYNACPCCRSLNVDIVYVVDDQTFADEADAEEYAAQEVSA